MIVPLIGAPDGKPDTKDSSFGDLTFQESGSEATNNPLGYAKGQMFEFNSIIYTGMGRSLKMSNDSESPLTYEVSFTCPNSFQGSFKKDAKGMQNRANDKTYFNGKIPIFDKYAEKHGYKYEDTGNILDNWD